MNMKNKMNVINMGFLTPKNQPLYSPNTHETNDDSVRDMVIQLVQILKDGEGDRVDRVRRFITENRLQNFLQVFMHFIRTTAKIEIEDLNVRNGQQGEKVFKDNLQKTTKKLSQAMLYIENIRTKLAAKHSELTLKNQTIATLKKQCFQWKQKAKKSNLIKQLSENSSSLLKNMQIVNMPYQKPEEIEFNLDASSDSKENAYSRTSYQTVFRCKKEDTGRKNYSAIPGYNERLKKHKQKRTFRKTFDRMSTKIQKVMGKEQGLINNGLQIAQKQIKSHPEKRKNRIIQ